MINDKEEILKDYYSDSFKFVVMCYILDDYSTSEIKTKDYILHTIDEHFMLYFLDYEANNDYTSKLDDFGRGLIENIIQPLNANNLDNNKIQTMYISLENLIKGLMKNNLMRQSFDVRIRELHDKTESFLNDEKFFYYGNNGEIHLTDYARKYYAALEWPITEHSRSLIKPVYKEDKIKCAEIDNMDFSFSQKKPDDSIDSSLLF